MNTAEREDRRPQPWIAGQTLAALLLWSCAAEQPATYSRAGTPSAGSDVKPLAVAGEWLAASRPGVTGRPQCVMSNVQNVVVYYESGDDHFSIQVSKPDWVVRNGGTYSVRLAFDNETPWDAIGEGGHFAGGRPYVDMDLRFRDLPEWMHQFTTSDFLAVAFPGSDVSSWSANLSGTQRVALAFLRCVQTITS